MDLKIKYSPIKIEHYSYIEYSNIFLEIPEIYEISNTTIKYINKEIIKINNLKLLILICYIKMIEKFICDDCNYVCYDKSNYNRHLKTIKHVLFKKQGSTDW